MNLQGKKLGLLIAAAPHQPNFLHGLGVAKAALEAGVTVYLYFIDEAVRGLADERLQELKQRGVKLFACAYSAQRRHVEITDHAVPSGLILVNDLLTATDRFLNFN
ncbi:MAG: DsrE family protein [Verrucomicrobiota bacterium]